VNKYIWTGDITEEMYDLFCSFTDPTLSFVGLDTFRRNLVGWCKLKLML